MSAAEVDKGDGPKTKRKRLAWDEVSELALLDMWPERMEMLRGQRKTGHIYAEMAMDLSKLGHNHSARNVQVKLQNFTQRYRKEKATMDASGGSVSAWPYYARVHQIIGSFKANTDAELDLERLEESSISALRSPSTPLPSSSLALSSSSTSLPSSAASHPSPGTLLSSQSPPLSSSNNFQATLLKKFEELSNDISQYLKKSEENAKQLIAIEKEKAECLKKIARDNEELKNALRSKIKKE